MGKEVTVQGHSGAIFNVELNDKIFEGNIIILHSHVRKCHFRSRYLVVGDIEHTHNCSQN